MTLPERERPIAEPVLAELIRSLDGWQLDGAAITKTYTLKGFKAAMAFAQRIGEAASAAGHHPDIHIERYKHVRVVLTTHASGAVSQADIDLARAIEGAHTAPSDQR